MGLFDNIWIIPNPGDAGSSLGCIAAHQKSHLNWEHPFLGHNIEGEYPVDSLIKELKENRMVGVASGRAEYGKEFPAIIHHDHTSRVQTVRKTDNPGFHALLTEWKRQTGCPILLNTSLNIKGQPIVNDREDGRAFTNKYGVKVLG
jgi:predicted NodU family carbamoyl transferase